MLPRLLGSLDVEMAGPVAVVFKGDPYGCWAVRQRCFY
jgi:DNA topoisomerase VI subunit A